MSDHDIAEARPLYLDNWKEELKRDVNFESKMVGLGMLCLDLTSDSTDPPTGETNG